MVKVSINTAPVLRPVTVAEFKEWARIDHTDDDATLIPRLLDEAIEAAEVFLWRKLITQTWDEYFDDFADPLKLRYSPASSITSVTYYDSNQTLQTLATTVYELGELYNRSVVRRKYNQDWPTPLDHEDMVIVRYVVGYGTTGASVPAPIRDAICVHATWGYDRQRGDIPLPFPSDFRDKLRPYSLRGWAAIGAK